MISGCSKTLRTLNIDIEVRTCGALETYTLGNGLSEKRTYDSRRRLVSMSATNPAGEVVRGLRYGLDSTSRIVEIADLRQAPPADEDLTASFTYDDRYRLKTATYRTGATAWQHDDVSKILSVNSDFGAPHLNVVNAYGESGAGPDALTHHGTEAITYDAAGRVTQDGQRTYSWDAKGRVTKIIRGKTIEEYVYGHDDARAIKLTTTDGTTEVTRYIEKDVEERNGNLIRYAYLGDQRIARLDPVDVGPRTAPVTKTGGGVALANDGETGAGSAVIGAKIGRVARRLLVPWGCVALAALGLLHGLRVVSGKRIRRLPIATERLATAGAWLCALSLVGLTIQACSAEGNHRMLTFREQSVEITSLPEVSEFYLTDAQESPLAVTTKSAVVKSRTALHPFGHVRFQTGKQTDPWGFVGNEEDRGSGISDFHARPYRPELGAFLAVDPVALLTPEKLLEKPRAFAAYLYAISDPLNNVDADGLEPQKKGFWTRLGQNAIHLVEQTICMGSGGCSYANAPAPGERTYPQLTPAEVALNLTAAYVAPRLSAGIGSRILRSGAPLTAAKVALPGEFGAEDVAFGLARANGKSGALIDFAGKATLGTRAPLSPSTSAIGSGTARNLAIARDTIRFAKETVTRTGGKLRFNLDGFDVRQALSRGTAQYNSVTSAEFRGVMSDPVLLGRTEFYRDGRNVSKQVIQEAASK